MQHTTPIQASTHHKCQYKNVKPTIKQGGDMPTTLFDQEKGVWCEPALLRTWT